MHLLWAPRWVSRKVDALLEWPGCPGGGDVAHRKPGCRPPLAPPQTCRLPTFASGHPFPKPGPACWPPTPRPSVPSAPAPTLCVFAPVQRGSELQSQGLRVWGVFWNFSVPSLAPHPVCRLHLRPVSALSTQLPGLTRAQKRPWSLKATTAAPAPSPPSAAPTA